MEESAKHLLNEESREPVRWFFWISMLFSIGYATALSIPYGVRPDAWLALTVFPVWVWTLLPILLMRFSERSLIALRQQFGYLVTSL